MKYRFLFLTTLLTMVTISWTAETPETNGALSVDEHRQLLQKAIETCNKRCSVTSGKTRPCFSECMHIYVLQEEKADWKRATAYCGVNLGPYTPSKLDCMSHTMHCSDPKVRDCVLAKLQESRRNRKTAAKEAKKALKKSGMNDMLDGIDQWELTL